MHEQTIPTLLWVYFGLVFVNILITLVQLLIERGLAERTLFLFWLGIALATFSNTLFPDQPVLTLATSPIGTFISQLFLGRFFAHIHDIRVPWKPFLFSFIFGYLTSQLLGLTDVGLTFQSMPVVLGATLPVPGHFYLVHKRSRYKYSTMQMLFISVALLMSLHYLDWGFFRARPFLFVYGLSLAIALYHILATITPLISSESTLQKRNQNLEEEVRHKASLLTSTERQLWEANKMASYARMAGGMAHEINTPLQVIEFQAEELRSEIESHPNGSEEMKSGLDTIQEMVLRISKITNSLRKLARENLSVLFQVADLGDMARSAIANLAPVAISQSTHLISRVPDTPLKIHCIPNEIFQVIDDLLRNALDAVSQLEQREVALEIKERDAVYEMYVTDTGQVDEHVIPRLMEPFFTTKAIGAGIGLALSVARSIAERHKGKLYLDRTHPHTRFVLELPKAGAPPS